MSDISALESRLSAALSRIGTRLDALPDDPVSADPSGINAIPQETLDEIATLESEIVQLSQDKEDMAAERAVMVRDMAAKDKELSQIVKIVTGLEADVSKLTQSNTELRDIADALRTANAQGLGDADKIILADKASKKTAQIQAVIDKNQLSLFFEALDFDPQEDQNA